MAAAALARMKNQFFSKESKSEPPKSKISIRSAATVCSTSSGSSMDKNERRKVSAASDSILARLHKRRQSNNNSSSNNNNNNMVVRDTVETLAQLERVCTIGTGTFGRVFLVRNQSSNEFYALKVESIRHVVTKRQVDHVHNEKRILEQVNHPFIVNLLWTCHDSKCLYLLFEYIPGGELFSYLRAAQRFTNNTTRFYASELICVLDYLHRLNVVFRDLKPENLLLDKTGHLKVIDFGFAKVVVDDKRTFTVCGTPEYLAPEIIKQEGHDKAVDWWGLGVLLFEMMAGYPPFRGGNPFETYEKILDGKIRMPTSFHKNASDIVHKLLQVDPLIRLGQGPDDADAVKKHRWFKAINWSDVHCCRLTPPIIPTLYYEGDTGNYDAYAESDFGDYPTAKTKELALFANF